MEDKKTIRELLLDKNRLEQELKLVNDLITLSEQKVEKQMTEKGINDITQQGVRFIIKESTTFNKKLALESTDLGTEYTIEKLDINVRKLKAENLDLYNKFAETKNVFKMELVEDEEKGE